MKASALMTRVLNGAQIGFRCFEVARSGHNEGKGGKRPHTGLNPCRAASRFNWWQGGEEYPFFFQCRHSREPTWHYLSGLDALMYRDFE